MPVCLFRHSPSQKHHETIIHVQHANTPKQLTHITTPRPHPRTTPLKEPHRRHHRPHRGKSPKAPRRPPLIRPDRRHRPRHCPPARLRRRRSRTRLRPRNRPAHRQPLPLPLDRRAKGTHRAGAQRDPRDPRGHSSRCAVREEGCHHVFFCSDPFGGEAS